MEALRSPITVYLNGSALPGCKRHVKDQRNKMRLTLNCTRERCSLPNALIMEPFAPKYSTMMGDDRGREEIRRRASAHCARPDATSLGDDAN
jgi:hypothetical protein